MASKLMSTSVERFSSRVENYALYRPGYPAQIMDLLKTECGLTSESVIADLGSGTGKLAEIFLRAGNPVIGVEPNEGMRAAGDRILSSFPRFRSVSGSAEATTLPDDSVDFITAGQAFHWFEPKAAKAESKRILKPDGWMVLVWNERQVDTTPFLRDYEQLLLRYGTDYQEVRHENAAQTIIDFFAPNTPILRTFENSQRFDLEGLRGRVLSSSYTPEPQHPSFAPMMTDLKRIFDEHQQNGYVSFHYITSIHFGHLNAWQTIAARDFELGQ